MSILVDPVVSIVVESLGQWLIGEARSIQGVRRQVEKIQTELSYMKCFLVDAADHELGGGGGRGQTVHNLVLEVQDIAYYAEDVIETFVLKVASRRGRGGIQSFIKRYSYILNEWMLRRNIGLEIQEIKGRICELKERLPTYGVRALSEEQGSGGGGGHESRLRRMLRQTYPHDEEKDFVGLHEDVDKLVGVLLKEDSKYCSVCISGMGGSGKTTLAKKVYNHRDVKRGFDCFAWVCISQQFNVKDVLQTILIELSPGRRDEILKLMEAEMVKQLYGFLQSNKCLVVIDDIWKTVDWDCLKPAIPIGRDMGRTKILLTTRNTGLAFHVDPHAYFHQPRLLNDDEAWELVQKKAFHNPDSVGNEIVELGREMVKHCGGLPLGLIVLGGILVTKHTLREWEGVLKNIKSYISRGGEGIGQENRGVSDVLELSYNELPHQLKPCFLYLGNFGEDREIEAEELYQMWIAEGMVLKEDKVREETMLEVAERYLGELERRCMVQLVQGKDSVSDREFYCVRLHDLMRDLSLSKAKQENFLEVVNYSGLSFSTSNCKVRRLAVYLDDHSDDKDGAKGGNVEKEKIDQCIRSLLLWNKRDEKRNIPDSIQSSLKAFKTLRVLYLFKIEFSGKLPKAIGKLIHLRYLKLRSCSFEEGLPSSIGNLRCLQTLDLRSNYDYEPEVPNVVWKMVSLRHLYLGDCICAKGKLRLDGLREIETLQFERASLIDVDDLFKLINIRKLEARVDAAGKLKGMMKYLNNPRSRLQHASLYINCDFCSKEELRLVEQLASCHSLNLLRINGTISKLPQHQHFSPSLRKLILDGSKLEEDPMPTLEKLPNLRSLTLDTSFVGLEMVCSGMGFPKLKYLLFGGFPNLEEWRVDEGAMPNLSNLGIVACKKLKMVPDGLRFITTLQELVIHRMPQAFKRRLEVVDGEEGADLYKVQHVPSIHVY